MLIYKGDERKRKRRYRLINKIKKINVMKIIFDLSFGEIVYYFRFKNGEYRSGIIGILLVFLD